MDDKVLNLEIWAWRMEKERFGGNKMGICCEGRQDKIWRAVVLKRKKFEKVHKYVCLYTHCRCVRVYNFLPFLVVPVEEFSGAGTPELRWAGSSKQNAGHLPRRRYLDQRHQKDASELPPPELAQRSHACFVCFRWHLTWNRMWRTGPIRVYIGHDVVTNSCPTHTGTALVKADFSLCMSYRFDPHPF